MNEYNFDNGGYVKELVTKWIASLLQTKDIKFGLVEAEAVYEATINLNGNNVHHTLDIAQHCMIVTSVLKIENTVVEEATRECRAKEEEIDYYSELIITLKNDLRLETDNLKKEIALITSSVGRKVDSIIGAPRSERDTTDIKKALQLQVNRLETNVARKRKIAEDDISVQSDLLERNRNRLNKVKLILYMFSERA